MNSYKTRSTYENVVLAGQIVELMNEALKLDPRAVSQLLEHRVDCTEALAEHATIQTVKEHVSNTSGAAVLVSQYKVGLLGILNGICGVGDDVRGFIEAVYYDHDASKVAGFQLSSQARVWLTAGPT